MAYNERLPEGIEALLRHKELAQLTVSTLTKADRALNIDHNPLFVDEILHDNSILFLHPHQLFARAYMGPNSANKRMLCEHETGTGKTLTALATSFEYVKYYKAIDLAGGKSPSIFIIGFSKSVFQRELLRRPEFGFISKDEMREQIRLRQLATAGTASDKLMAAEYDSRLRSRLTKHQWDGYFRFMGYKEFFNRLFIIQHSDNQSAQNVAEIGTDDTTTAVHNIVDEDNVVAEEQRGVEYYYQAIRDGHMRLNFDLLDLFVNSFVIGDELHHAYNAAEINNYGVALQVLLDIFEAPEHVNKLLGGCMSNERITTYKHAMLKLLILTATPMNNSPTEIVDILNLLVPELATNHLVKTDLFENKTGKLHLKDGAGVRIARLIRGYVSFLRDVDPKYFPIRRMEGETIPVPNSVRSEANATLPYLKFIRCAMSPLHYETYKESIRETGTISSDGKAIIDLCLPRPNASATMAGPGADTSLDDAVMDEFGPTNMHTTVAATDTAVEFDACETTTTNNKEIGMYRSRDIRALLMQASRSWKDKMGIDVQSRESVGRSNAGYIITGDFLREDRLAEYSTKYATLARQLIDNLRHDRGKAIVSHPYVRISGVLFIQELLKRNGFLDEFANPTDDTLCSKCGVRRVEHAKSMGTSPTHEFIPARFIMAFGEIDAATLDRSREKFNAATNVDGYEYRVLIGSRVINEAYDFKAVQQIYVTHVPVDISTLLQILGRGIRKFSHDLLPATKRFVHVYIMVSSLPMAARGPKKNLLSYEELRYYDKLMGYLIIQQIDKIIHENAIDGTTFRQTIMPDESSAAIASIKNELGMLYFRPSNTLFTKNLLAIGDGTKTWTPEQLDTIGFMTRYADDEIGQIVYIIKRLFLEQSAAWIYDDLWAAVKSPPFQVYVNTKLFSDSCFNIALDLLTVLSSTQHVPFRVNIMDPLNAIIIKDNTNYRIFWKSPYYIMLPVQNIESIVDTNISPSYGVQQLGVPISQANMAPVYMAESWLRRADNELLGSSGPAHRRSIPIGRAMATQNMSFDQMKQNFFKQYDSMPIDRLPQTTEIYDLGFHIKLAEEAIVYWHKLFTKSLEVRSQYHEFYYKMLYFYDKLEMIVFADDVDMFDESLARTFRNIVGPVNLNYNIHNMEAVLKEASDADKKLIEQHRHNSFAAKTWDREQQLSLPFNPKAIDDFLEQNNGLVPANLFIAGHLLNGDLRVFTPGHDWFASTIVPPQEHAVENNLIIGYYDKPDNGIKLIFKTRRPWQLQEIHKDSRLNENGAMCSTKTAVELIKILNMLDIKEIPVNTREKCAAIKNELIRRELAARSKYKNDLAHCTNPNQVKPQVKWFYMHFESHLMRS
jgi:hypothetical protein